MKDKDWPSVKEFTKNGKRYFKVDLRRINESVKSFPRTAEGHKKAKALVAQIKEQQKNLGDSGFLLSLEQMADATTAIKLLNEYYDNTTLTAFIQTHTKNVRAVEDCTLAVAFEEYMVSKESGNGKQFKASTIKEARTKVGRFVRSFKYEHPVHKVSPEDVALFLDTCNLKGNSRRSYWSCIKVFFDFCIKQKWCVENPVVDLEKPDRVYVDIQILPPEDARTLFECVEAIEPSLAVPFALKMFAGLRSSEVEGLTFGDIDLDAGYIHVSTTNSKTKRERFVAIESNLNAILSIHLAPFSTEATFPWSDYLWKRVLRDWGKVYPKNAARKSYISYHSRLYNDLGRTAENAGHHVGTSLAHYKALCTPEQAQEYFSIGV